MLRIFCVSLIGKLRGVLQVDIFLCRNILISLPLVKLLLNSSFSNEAISAINIVKSFRKRKAISNLNISIPEGRKVALLGPNGAGKSTALKIICGILKPDYGEVRIKGMEPNSPEAKKAIGFLPEDASPYPTLSVRENLEYIGAIRSTENLEDRIDELVNTLAISEYMEMRVSSLSRGNRQKVAVALSLIHRPEIMVMDEPLNYLDIPTQENLISLFSEMKGTFLVSTHIMSIAEKLTDHVIIIARGQEIWKGSTDELRRTGIGQESIEQIVSRLMKGVSSSP